MYKQIVEDAINQEENTFLNVIRIMKANSRLYLDLKEAMGEHYNMNFAFLIEKHKSLLTRFIRSQCIKTPSIERAIASMNADSVLVYITELALYGVFSPQEYLTFIQNVAASVEEYPDTVTYTPKQIILSGFPQKVIFVCNADDAVIERIRAYCERYFKSPIQTAKNGDKIDVIVQNPIVNNLEESQQLLEKFMHFVSTQEKVPIEELGIATKNVMKIGDSRYISSAMANHLDINTLIDLISRLNGGHITININIGNNNNVIIGGNGNVIAQAAENPHKKWIDENPPANNRELKKDYYARYRAAVNNPVNDSVFGKLVNELGKYKSSVTRGANYWKVK